MSAISSISAVSAAATSQAAQSAPPAKQAQSKPIEDTVQLSKTAQAALSGDADGDSR